MPSYSTAIRACANATLGAWATARGAIPQMALQYCNTCSLCTGLAQLLNVVNASSRYSARAK
eukprot:11220919-Lingulodinium_polyedra.AAC.1